MMTYLINLKEPAFLICKDMSFSLRCSYIRFLQFLYASKLCFFRIRGHTERANCKSVSTCGGPMNTLLKAWRAEIWS